MDLAKYEIYNTDTEQVEDVIEETAQQAAQANKDLKHVGSPLRHIPWKEPAPDSCRCGAEFKFECVCESDGEDDDFFDPEDIYGVLGHDDTPSLDQNLNY